MLLRKYRSLRYLIDQICQISQLNSQLSELRNEVAELRHLYSEHLVSDSTPASNEKQESQAEPEQPEVISYQSWMDGVIKDNPAAPPFWLYSSFYPGSTEYNQIITTSHQAEFKYARNLISEPAFQKVPGEIVEFGVFEGGWLEQLADEVDEKALEREVWGFDSFEGLPETGEHDLDCWHGGQYSADYESVSKRLKCEDRPYLNLVKGWFSDTLQLPEVQAIQKIAYARVDCDLYQPAVECLEFLESRLVHNSILVFDDWTWDLEKGETRAFREWVEKGCGLNFEFLFFNCNGHLYLRVIKESAGSSAGTIPGNQLQPQNPTESDGQAVA